MLPQPGGECAVAVPPGSVPARQRWPHPASCRIIQAHRAAEAGPGGRSRRPPRARAPATRPPAVPGRLLQAALLCHRRDGTPRMLTAHQATAGAGAVRTRRLTGPGGAFTAARLVRPARQRHGPIDAYVRVAPPCVRAAAASEVRWALWPPRPPHCARRSGTGPGDRTLASALAAGSSQPSVPDGSMECDCARARRPVRSPDGNQHGAPAARPGVRYGHGTHP